jgi:hypothetical protein
MKVKNQRSYRKYYKKHEANSDDPKVNVNYVGHSHRKDDGELKFGFFQMLHGNKKDEKGFLRSDVLNIAADHQAVYELIQNADDAGSEMVLIHLAEDHLIALNTGKPFHYLAHDESGRENKGRVASLLNVGQSDKGIEEIGTFGIGFKIVHRLLGEDDAADALSEEYKGPSVFSWFNKEQFEGFIDSDEEIEVTDKDDDSSKEKYPWLFKILMTAFPAAPNETVRDLDYEKRVAFPEEEVNAFRTALNEVVFNELGDFVREMNFEEGVALYIPLGPGKYELVSRNLHMLNTGVGYSFNFLKNLKRIYFQSEKLEKLPIQTEAFVASVGSDDYQRIQPRVERDVEITFAYFDDYKKAAALVESGQRVPNFYNYFAMEQEMNDFRFLVHSNAFDMQNNRRELQTESDINNRLLPVVAEKIRNFIVSQKDNNPEKYRNLFATVLLSKKPEEKKHIREYFFEPLSSFLTTGIPVQSGDYLKDADLVKIKNIQLDLDLQDFGFENAEWFYWADQETDGELIEAAQEVLGLGKWDIKDLIENTNTQDLNAYFQKASIEEIEEFLQELCEIRSIRDNVVRKMLGEVAFVPFGDKRYTISEVKNSEHLLFRQGFVAENQGLLERLGLEVSDIDLEDERFSYLFEKMDKVTEQQLFQKIDAFIVADEHISDELCLEVYNTLVDENAPESIYASIKTVLPEISWFKDGQREYKAIKELISPEFDVPEWLLPYQVSITGFKDTSFFVQEKQVFNHTIYPFWEDIIKTIEKEDIPVFLQEVKAYHDLHDENEEAVRSLTGKNYLLCKGHWYSRGENYAYLNLLQETPRYETLVANFRNLSTQELPDPVMLPYLSESPFKTDEQPIDTGSFIQAEQPARFAPADADALLSLDPKKMLEHFWVEEIDGDIQFVKHDHATVVMLKSDTVLMDIAPELKSVVAEKWVKLPKVLSNYNEHLPTDDSLLLRIVQNVDLDQHLLQTLQLPLSTNAFKTLLGRSGWLIEIDSATSIEEGSSAHQFFKLVERHFDELTDQMPAVKNHLRIWHEEEWKALPSRTLPADLVKFDGKEYRLSLLSPKTFAFQGFLNRLKEDLKERLSINKKVSYKVLGLADSVTETRADEIIGILKADLEGHVLVNTEQLRFVLNYYKDYTNRYPSSYSGSVNPFKVHTEGGLQSVYSNYFYRENAGDFIKPTAILSKAQYPGFEENIKFKWTSVKKRPGIESGQIELSGLKSELTDRDRMDLLDFLTEQYFRKPNASAHLRDMDASKLQFLAEKLNFKHGVTVFPATAALPSEQPPVYFATWLQDTAESSSLQKLEFLKAIGVNTPETPIVKVRQALLNGQAPENEDLRALTGFRNLFSFIVHKQMRFDDRQEVFTQIQKNAEAADTNFSVTREIDLEKLEEQSHQIQNNDNYENWREESGWDVRVFPNYQFLPHLVKTNYSGSYAFMTAYQEEYFVKGTTIFTVDSYQDDLLQLFRMAGVPEELYQDFRSRELEDRFKDDNEDPQLPPDENVGDQLIDEIASQMREISLDIPEEDRISINYEALLIAWRFLKDQGFNVDEVEMGNATIKNVLLEGDPQPLNIKVRSGRNGFFFLKASDWKALEDHSTLLIVYSGGGLRGCTILQKQADLINHFSQDDEFQIIRLEKQDDPQKLTQMMDALLNIGGQGHLIFRSKSSKRDKYQSIFSNDKWSNRAEVPELETAYSNDDF